MLALQSPVGILDSHAPLQEPSQLQRSKIEVPDAVINLLEADVLAGAGDRDVHPVAFPTDAAIGAHVAHFEAVGVFQGRKPIWPRRSQN